MLDSTAAGSAKGSRDGRYREINGWLDGTVNGGMLMENA